jgi:hypothetical protein
MSTRGMSIGIVPSDTYADRSTRRRSGAHRRSFFLTTRVEHGEDAMKGEVSRECRRPTDGESDLFGRYAVVGELRVVRLQGRHDGSHLSPRGAKHRRSAVGTLRPREFAPTAGPGAGSN